jgi:hypothetical protein
MSYDPKSIVAITAVGFELANVMLSDFRLWWGQFGGPKAVVGIRLDAQW